MEIKHYTEAGIRLGFIFVEPLGLSLCVGIFYLNKYTMFKMK